MGLNGAGGTDMAAAAKPPDKTNEALEEVLKLVAEYVVSHASAVALYAASLSVPCGGLPQNAFEEVAGENATVGELQKACVKNLTQITAGLKKMTPAREKQKNMSLKRDKLQTERAMKQQALASCSGSAEEAKAFAKELVGVLNTYKAEGKGLLARCKQLQQDAKQEGLDEEDKVGDEDSEARMDALESLAEVLEAAVENPSDKAVEAALTRSSLVLAAQFKEMKLQAAQLNTETKETSAELKGLVSELNEIDARVEKLPAQVKKCLEDVLPLRAKAIPPRA